MIAVLQTLADLPGVRLVMLATQDGVPIAIPGRTSSDSSESGGGGLGSDEALAALTASWFSEVGRHASQLSWNEPRRAVLKAARGTLVVQRLKNAILVVLLARGLDPEVVRLAMDGTAARIDRNVRGMGRDSVSTAASTAGDNGTPEPLSPLPAPKEVSEPSASFSLGSESGQETEGTSGN